MSNKETAVKVLENIVGDFICQCGYTINNDLSNKLKNDEKIYCPNCGQKLKVDWS